MVSSSTAVLATSDVLAAVKFYTDVLGFESHWTYGEPPTFGAAQWGNVAIMFNFDPDLARQVEGHQHWLNVEDVDALHALHQERGADIVSEIEDKPWGRREYTVRDLNGYHLRFTGNPSYSSKGAGEFPTEVKILRRKPTVEEHDRVAGSAFYKNDFPTEVINRSWSGVVAELPGGEVIGVLRIMYDAPGWFSIWDVAVLPEWQGRRIGTGMMNAALDIVREESPGASVHLFTHKHGFYERLGFTKESVDRRTV